MTFADEKVVDALNAKFVLAWSNHAVDGDGGGEAAVQPKWSDEELVRYPEGGGGGNVRTYIALPDGRVIHYIQGWFRPERFLEELDFALSISENGAVAEHAGHEKKHLDEQRRIEKEHPAEMNKPFEQSAKRREHARLGLQAELHRGVNGVLHQPIQSVLEAVRRENSERGVIK